MSVKSRGAGRRPDHSLIAAIDVGVSKVACFIASPSPDGVDVHGVGCCGATGGVQKRRTRDDLEKAVRSAVASAEKMAGARVERAIFSVPGRQIVSRRVGVDLEIAGGVVTEDDIDESLDEAARFVARAGERELAAIPVGYAIDGDDAMADPVGFSGDILSTEVTGLSVRDSVIDNLTSIAERAGLRAKEFFAAPHAAAEAVLTDDERDLGVIMIDIGAASTEYAVYENGGLAACGGVPVGGNHLTRDIAQVFGVSVARAETLKIRHGAALVGAGDENRFVDAMELGDDAHRIRISRAELCDVLIARIEEIYELVAAALPGEANADGLRRAVLCGGGSLLPGAREVAERSLRVRCRTGRPSAAIGAPDAATAPGFAVCAGLVKLAIFSPQERNVLLGVSGGSPHTSHHASLIGGFGAWLRERF